MAILCERHKLLFIMNPRTACTAVAEVLLNELDGRYVPERDITDARGRMLVQQKHGTVPQLVKHGVVNRAKIEELHKVTTVRNPFDSVVSLYEKQRSKYVPLLDDPTSWVHSAPGYVRDMHFARDHSFEEWVLRRYPPPGLRTWLNPRSAARKLLRHRRTQRFVQGVDRVMRFEHLQDDFDRLLSELDIDNPPAIPRINTTDSRRDDYRSYYTPIARRAIEYHFAATLERFGYRFEAPTPASEPPAFTARAF